MEIKSETNFRRVGAVTELSCESAADYILPDYLGDVRKVLHTECHIRPSGKFADGEEVEFTGNVVYDVVYLDSEGKVTGVNFTSDYEGCVKCQSEGAWVYLEPAVSSYAVRLTGPRRFSAKSQIGGHAAIVSEEIVAASGSAFGGDFMPETLTCVMNLRSTDSSERIQREFDEVIEGLEGVIADEVEILYSGAEIDFDTPSAGDGDVTVQGELTIYAIVAVDGSPIYLVEKSVPFEEKIPFAGLDSDMRLLPIGELVSLSTSVKPTDDGAEITSSAILSLGLRAEYNERVEAVTDAFVRACPSENTYKEYRYTELVDCIRVSENDSTIVKRESLPSENLREIVYLTLSPKVESISGKGGALHLQGELRFSGVATEVDESGEVGYVGLKFSCPLDTTLRASAHIPDEVRAEATFAQTVAHAIIDADSIELGYTLCGSVTLTEGKSLTVLTSCDAVPDQSYTEVSGRITVYYPEKNETLFDIARRFHKSQADLARDNNITVTTSADGTPVTVGENQRIYIF